MKSISVAGWSLWKALILSVTIGSFELMSVYCVCMHMNLVSKFFIQIFPWGLIPSDWFTICKSSEVAELHLLQIMVTLWCATHDLLCRLNLSKLVEWVKGKKNWLSYNRWWLERRSGSVNERMLYEDFMRLEQTAGEGGSLPYTACLDQMSGGHPGFPWTCSPRRSKQD